MAKVLSKSASYALTAKSKREYLTSIGMASISKSGKSHKIINMSAKTPKK